MKKIYLLLVLCLGFYSGALGQSYVYRFEYKASNSNFATGNLNSTAELDDGRILTQAIIGISTPTIRFYNSLPLKLYVTNSGCGGGIVTPNFTAGNSWTTTFVLGPSCTQPFNTGINIEVKALRIARTPLKIPTKTIFCETETIPFSFPGQINPLYNSVGWYISMDPFNFNLPAFKQGNSSVNVSIADVRAVYPNYNGELLYVKGFVDNEYSELSSSFQFVSSPPIPQIKNAYPPLCSNGLGSLELNDFKNTNGSQYLGGQNLSVTVTNTSVQIPNAPILFSSSSLIVPNLTPGVYTAQLSNGAANCTSNLTFTIPNAPPPITASASGQNPDCSAGTGTVTAIAGGGTPPYQYSINGGANQTTNIFTGLTAGTYTVKITDVNGCAPATSNAVSIVAPTAINTVLNNKTNPTGFGLSNGQIIVSANGGSGTGYTYSIDGVNYSASDTFSSLAAGSYNLKTKDSKGCESAALVVILTGPTPLLLSVNAHTNNLCYGANTGTVDVLATGGTAPYQYSINGTTYQVSPSFSNLAAGNYTVIVKDNASIQANATVNILQPDVIAASIVGQNPSCVSTGGTITATATGGTAPYKYAINGGNYQSSNLFGNLSAGSYSVSVSDVNNCSAATSNTISITMPNAVITNLSFKNDPTSFNGIDGKIEVVGSGGTGNGFTYSIDGTNYSTSGAFNNLSASTYSLTTKDGNGCLSPPLSIVLNQPNQFSINISSKTDNVCFGASNGAVSVIAGGGLSPFQYEINGGGYQNSPTFNNLSAGNYIVTAKDANDYEVSTNITIVQPSAITASITAQNPDCASDLGIVSATAGGGTAPYQYSLNGGSYQTSNIFTGIAAGSYTVAVRDAGNCTPKVSNAVNITVPNAVAINLSFKNNPTTTVASDGQIAVNATGGSNIGFVYAINNSTFSPSGTFTGLAAGTYSIQAKDSKGCLSVPISVTLNQANLLSINVTGKTDNDCYGNNIGNVSVSGSGGVPPYQFSINNGAYQSTGVFIGLAANNYNLSVKDANNDIANASIIITQPASITASIVKTDAPCLAGNGSIIINNPSGGSGSGFTYSVDGGTNYQSTNIFNVPAGTYLVKLKDGNGCVSQNFNITIAQPASGLQINSIVQNVKCSGFASGIITLNVTGGSGGYIYSKDNWASSNTTGIFTGLLAGTYNFQVRDQVGCLASLSQTVTQPQELILHIDQKTDPACFGGTGSIAISATGGEGIMAYSSTPTLAFSNGVFTGAVAGNYEIKLIDGNGCIKFENVTISQPTQLIGSAAVTAAKCNGDADGAVVLTAIGGASPYTYGIKNTGIYSSSNTFNGLTAGSYVFTIKDANSCISDVTVIVTQPNAITLTVINKQDVLCNGANNGSFLVNASGGNGNYNYTLNGINQTSSGSYSNLAPGNYVLRGTDSKGCFAEINVSIVEPANLQLSVLNKVDLKCAGGNDGTIQLGSSGGVTPYQYAINGGGYQSSAKFSMLEAGNYSLTVKDANGCIKSLNVTITQPSALLTAITKDDVNCFGDASGKITIAAYGGSGGYQYAINGGAFQLNNVFSNLAAGNYNLTTKDNNNCTISETATINNIAPKLVLNLDATSPTTCDDTGTIKVNSTIGGVSPFLYSVDGNTFSSNQIFSDLVSGQYTVFVKDANGCIASASKTISVPSGINAQAVATHVLCFGNNSGKIVVNNPTGGNGNYTYSINGTDFQSSNTFATLKAGNYTLVVKDNPYSCKYTLNIPVIEPSKLNLELKSKTNISCNNQQDGKIEVLANGGTLPYQYSIDGGVGYVSSGIFTNLKANDYTILVKDANGCTQIISVKLTEPAILNLVLNSKTDVTCFGAANGSVNLNATGGTPPYQFSLNGGSVQSLNQFDNLAGGNCLFQVKDASGCTANISTVINENPVLGIAIPSFKNLTCNNNNSGEIMVEGRGGSGVYQYSLNNGSYQTSSIFKNLAAGNYSIAVKDDKGCFSDAIQILNEPSKLLITKVVTQQKCFDFCSGEIKLSVTGGTQPYSYNWLSNPSFGNVSTLNNLCGGLYKVKITDANGCSVEDQIDIIIPDEIKITNLQDTVLCVGQVVTFDAGNPGYSYAWSADNGFNKTTQKVQISEGGKYQVKVTNTDGCSAIKSFSVQTSTTLLKANFLVSTFANVGDTVIVVDVSKPTPSKTTWMFDAGTTLIGSNATNSIKQVTFSTPGIYNMMMMVNLGQCADAVQKSITILPKDKKQEVKDALGYKEDLVQTLKVYPNPTNGEFKAVVKLTSKQDIKISMFSFSGQRVLEPQSYYNNDNFEIPFNQVQLTPGIYILTLESGNQTKAIKIIKL